MESVWFECLILHLCPQIVFLSNKILPKSVEKTKQVRVLPKLGNCIFATTSLDLWNSKGMHDIFTLVINLLGSNWQLKQMIIGLFETIETTRQALVTNLTQLFDLSRLRKKITYVKCEGSNLNAMITTLISLIKCEVLGLDESF